MKKVFYHLFQQGVDFDLAVVDNFMQGNNYDVVQRQATNVYNGTLSRDSRVTSARLVELNVRYATQQSAFAHEVINSGLYYSLLLYSPLSISETLDKWNFR